MNIDKFGHHVHKRMRVMDMTDKISIDKLLARNDNGDFDVKQSRLKGLKLPEGADEAVTKEYVDENYKICCRQQDFLTEIKYIKTELQLLKTQLRSMCTTVEVGKLIRDHIIALGVSSHAK